MLYLGIDQHSKQLTVCMRNQAGGIVLRREALEAEIGKRSRQRGPGEMVSKCELLMTAPGVGAYSGLAMVSIIGPIDRFPRPRSLANYFGLTPGCRNSGKSTDRLGSITKEGSTMARFLLGQFVLHTLKKYKKMRNWYRRIKLRRGSKIARVAMMRRLATIFWHMLKRNEPYCAGGPPRQRFLANQIQETVTALPSREFLEK